MQATPLPPTVTTHRADTELFSKRNGYYNIRPFSVSLFCTFLSLGHSLSYYLYSSLWDASCFYRLLLFAELPSGRETIGLLSQQWRCSLPLCRYARTQSTTYCELLVRATVALAV